MCHRNHAQQKHKSRSTSSRHFSPAQHAAKKTQIRCPDAICHSLMSRPEKINSSCTDPPPTLRTGMCNRSRPYRGKSSGNGERLGTGRTPTKLAQARTHLQLRRQAHNQWSRRGVHLCSPVIEPRHEERDSERATHRLGAPSLVVVADWARAGTTKEQASTRRWQNKQERRRIGASSPATTSSQAEREGTTRRDRVVGADKNAGATD